MAKCGAKNRSGGRCKQPGNGAGGRCKWHGGATPVGVAAPAWKHGRHSKYLPTRLAERYQDGLRDPNLNSLRSEMALTDARIVDLLHALGESGNTRRWKDARTKLDAFKAGAQKGRSASAAVRVALQELDDLIDAGLSESTTWDDLREWLDLRRKLSESETKREKDLMQLIPVTQVHAIMAVFLTEVKTNVPDATVLAHLSAFWAQLVGATGSGDIGTHAGAGAP
jgi:hypothetical protein